MTNEIKTTELEEKVIMAFNVADDPEEGTWLYVISEESGINSKQLSGVVSSLVQKGLAETYEGDEDMVIELTEAGFEIFEKLVG